MKYYIVAILKQIPFLFQFLKFIYNFILQINLSVTLFIKKFIEDRNRNHTTDSLHIFRPNSACDYLLMSKLTLLAANQTFQFLAKLTSDLYGKLKIFTVNEFWSSIGTRDIEFTEKLKQRFEFHRSDKATMHDYYLVYAAILSAKKEINGILEIGMGTNNENIASNMSKFGNPGASLRAFRDLLPNAMIYGADIDREILFEEERIKSYFVDQTDPDSFTLLIEAIPNSLDLIIDDGLHAPNANIATLNFALEKLKHSRNSWIVIEDIPEVAVPIWKVISELLPSEKYHSYLIETKAAYMYVCHKLI